MNTYDKYAEFASRLYDVLNGGVSIRYDCGLHATGPYKGIEASRVTLINMNTETSWKGLTSYQFVLGNNNYNTERRFSVHTEAKTTLSIVENSELAE